MEGAELRMNLKALKKIDPYIVSIEEHSSQVALYKFQSKSGEWEKTEMEGTLFVYKREAEPQYGFTIMNRLSMDNLVEPVTKELDFQLQAPFLLYRNHQGDIFGIWFYEQTVCERVGLKIELLVKEAEKNNANKQKSGTGDLASLFVKAAVKEKTPEKNKTDTSGQNLLRLLAGSKDLVDEVSHIKQAEEIKSGMGDKKTSASVLDFFAKADQGNQGNSQMIPGSSSAFTSVPMMVGPNGDRQSVMFDAAGHPVDSRAVYTTAALTAMPIEHGLTLGAVPMGGGLLGYPSQSVPGLVSGPGLVSLSTTQPLCDTAEFPLPSHPIADPSVNPLFQRLMSNPGPATEPISDPALLPVFQRLMSNPGALSVDQLERQQRLSVSPVSENGIKNIPKNVEDLESDLKAKLNIGLSRPPNNQQGTGLPNNLQGTGLPIQLGTGLANNLQCTGLPDSSKAQISIRSVEQVNAMLPHVAPAYPYPVPTYAPVPFHPPAYVHGANHTLLSPHVFSTRSTQSPSPSHLTNGSSSMHQVTPLTRAQMLQAVHYLLDNDDEFVTKLHEAYVRSLNSKFENF